MRLFFRTGICLFLMGVLVCPKAKAQSGFFITTDASSGNFWTALLLGYASTGINLLYTELIGDLPYYESDYGYVAPGVMGTQAYTDYRIIRENGNLVKIPDRWRSIFGFRAVDLFSQLKANVKIGWMGAYSPIGVYARAGIRHQNFALNLPLVESRYMIGTFCPGFGVRVAPGNFFDSGWTVQPFVEFGTNYNKTIYFEGPFDNDRDLLNEGLSYMLSAGVQINSQISVQFGAEWFAKDTFNTEYAVDGIRPYADVSSKMISFFIGVNRGF